MFGFIARMKWRLYRQYTKYAFNVSLRESDDRQKFFYNAFKALSFNGIDGDYAEFGCCGGMTFSLAYHEALRHKHKARLWAIDSFQGLPAPVGTNDAHEKWAEGGMTTSLDQFHSICASNGVPRDAYAVVPGFYDATLTPGATVETPSNIALAYVDCDLYSSTKTVLDFLKPRLKHGMILAFDDYFCWSASAISGERLAMLELEAEDTRWNFAPYVQYGWAGQSFIVEDRKLVAHLAK